MLEKPYSIPVPLRKEIHGMINPKPYNCKPSCTTIWSVKSSIRLITCPWVFSSAKQPQIFSLKCKYESSEACDRYACNVLTISEPVIKFSWGLGHCHWGSSRRLLRGQNQNQFHSQFLLMNGYSKNLVVCNRGHKGSFANKMQLKTPFQQLDHKLLHSAVPSISSSESGCTQNS